MNLPDIKALKELLKLLRAQGVLQYQSTDLNLVLTEAPQTTTKSKASEIMDDDEDEVLTPEQQMERMLFYSSDPSSNES